MTASSDADIIAEIFIDAGGQLCVVPRAASFPSIFRSAMEIHWDEAGRFLYAPKPREWTYFQWFQQILAAVKSEYGRTLALAPDTRWRNIESALRAEISSSMNRAPK